MKLTHLEHLEDLLFDGQFIQAIDLSVSLSEALIGGSSKHIRVSTKYDGAPAIVFGKHPQHGCFFIGTKSVFNKRIPKINFSIQDIISNHLENIDLTEKLIHSYDNLCEKDWDGVYQADLMFTPDSKRIDEKSISFTPNTITYVAPRDTSIGERVENSKLGLVIHTKYEGDILQDMNAVVGIDSPPLSDVCTIDPLIDIKNYILTELQYNCITDSIGFCEQSYNALKDRSIFTNHGKFLKMFVNYCIRIGESSGDVVMYETFLNNRNETNLANEVANRKVEFTTIFAIHKHLAYIKKILIKSMSLNHLFSHEVHGVPTTGEGFVVSYHGIPTKLVDRMEFSKLNFANNRFK